MTSDPKRISRREALKRVSLLLGGAISAPTLAGVLAGCESPQTATAGQPAALSGAQSEMVATLGEHILPQTDTPGARAARVHEFIDAMLADYYSEEERDRFLAGLERVDGLSQREFGKRFLELSSDEQFQIVEALNHATFEGEEAGLLEHGWDPADVGRDSFFRTLKELVLVGYYTSEVGATQELRPNPMGSWQADIAYSQAGQAWS